MAAATTTSAPAAIFAHLHSSPLVVRRRNGPEWRDLSSHGAATGAVASSCRSNSGLEPVDIIDVQEERKLLVQCLREANRRIAWHTEVADLHTFRKVLSFGCRVLHFSGHGVPGKLIFENNKCEAQFISQHELKNLLLAGGMERCGSGVGECRCESDALAPLPSSPVTAAVMPSMERQSRRALRLCGCTGRRQGAEDNDDGDNDDAQNSLIGSSEVERGWITLHPPPRVPVQLVFMSACHSESVAEAFVSAGVPHVVVVSKESKVLDKKAMEFSKAFYTALLAGHSVARAFEIGQVQADISIASDAGNSRFKLLGHGDHSKALFRDVPAGKFVENSIPAPVNECDAVAEVFVGRSLEMHQVFKALVEGARLVSITGDRGIGKTEIALQCAHYATERRVFRHIYYLSVEDSSSSSSSHSFSMTETPTLLSRVAQMFGTEAENEQTLANFVRQQCQDGNYLLILDGCNRTTRRDPLFRTLVSQLIRRVSSLCLLVTGDGKIGAMDGVGEKIIQIDNLPPADAALLFTLRAPRRLKAHEMGGSSDLGEFATHPIVSALRGHPRAICAVAQFLENKDMELDKHEFLNYIIPSVTAGLSVDHCSDDVQCFPVLPEDCNISSHPLQPHNHHHQHPVNPHHGHHHHHHHPHHHERWASMPSLPVHIGIKDSADAHTAVPCRSIAVNHGLRPRLEGTQSEEMHNARNRPRLEMSHSDSDLSRSLAWSNEKPEVSFRALKIADDLKAVIPDSTGRSIWASAVASQAGRLQSQRLLPLDELAPHISRYFATQLRSAAVKRPLSVRSIDFLSKSSLIWGGCAPSQNNGQVQVEWFAKFWSWFHPLTECIAHSRLWNYTQPRLLHGFLSKGACVSMLQRAPPGTFLIRFSETRLRCFVIVYVTEQQSVQFVPITWTEDGGWHVSLQDQPDRATNGVTFRTIAELVLSVTVLKFLFPQTPKEIAFQH